MLTRIEANTTKLTATAKMLSEILADEFVLFLKTLNAHWNMEGSDFYNKHIFFEVQYKEMMEIIDSLAERIRAIGHYAPATLSNYTALSHLSEELQQNNGSIAFIESLLADHLVIANLLRNYLASTTAEPVDAGSSDFISGLIATHEKMSWKLRAHL